MLAARSPAGDVDSRAPAAAATAEVLLLAADRFGLRSSVVSRITPAGGEQFIVACRNEPGGCDLPAERATRDVPVMMTEVAVRRPETAVAA